jgi:hypothetical protein
VERLILLAPICAAVAAGVVWLVLVRPHRHVEDVVEPIPLQLRSVLHVLQTQDELEEAVRRAANFERRATDETRSRADRYDAMITPSAITHIRGEQRVGLDNVQAHLA